MRMLMNNLDPEVAERPEDLVVYGGTGRAARSWEAYDAIVRTLRTLADDETLLVQSGKPVAVFRTHDMAPRVLISNSMLVPKWADWETFRALEAQGLTMYGQMTAGSWIYIGTQGILQGTYETLAECAHQHFGGSLAGTITLTGGLGGMGGAQPLAVTMNGGVALCVEVDPARIERRIETRYLDRVDRRSRRGGLLGRERAQARRGRVDRPRRQLRGGVPGAAGRGTSAPTSSPTRRARTIRSAATCPRACRCPKPRRCGASPMSTRSAPTSRWRTRSTPWWASPQAGSVVFDYGNNLRAGAEAGGLAPRRGLQLSRGSCRRSCDRSSAKARGRSAGRRSRATPPTSPRPTRGGRTLPRQRAAAAVAAAREPSGSRSRGCRRGSAGSATASATAPGNGSTSSWRAGRCRRPIVIGRDHLDAGSVASPEPRDRGDARRVRRDRRLADPQRVDQHGRRRALGERAPRRAASASATRSMPAWWWWPTDRRTPASDSQRVLTSDPGMGVVRHVDAGYDRAIEVARERGVRTPMEESP